MRNRLEIGRYLNLAALHEYLGLRVGNDDSCRGPDEATRRTSQFLGRIGRRTLGYGPAERRWRRGPGELNGRYGLRRRLLRK